MTDPPRSPCGSKNRYVLNSDGSKKSDGPGASHFTQSEDCDRLQRAESCHPGRCLYASVSQERRDRLVLRESPFTPRTRWSFAWHSHRYSANLCPLSWRIQIGSRSQQYSNWIASLSKIDPQPAQLNDVDLSGLVVLSTQLAYPNRQPFTAVFPLDRYSDEQPMVRAIRGLHH